MEKINNVVKSPIAPKTTNAIWINTEDNTINVFDEYQGWIQVSDGDVETLLVGTKEDREALTPSNGLEFNQVDEDGTVHRYIYEGNEWVLIDGVPTVTISESPETYELQANTLYTFTDITGDITFMLGDPTEDIVNEYHLFLTIGVSADPAPTITWPEVQPNVPLQWNGGEMPTITAGNTYEVSIMNGIALYIEVEPLAQS